MTFLALFLVALFRVETVNLDKLASVFANQAQSASSHKRLTRFFRGFAVDFDAISRAVVSWRQIPQPWTLSLDRTNWSFGSVHLKLRETPAKLQPLFQWLRRDYLLSCTECGKGGDT
ncbi:MAG: hypothetical protein ACFCU9_03965 [Cyanophyceae cyanobacterium]